MSYKTKQEPNKYAPDSGKKKLTIEQRQAMHRNIEAVAKHLPAKGYVDEVQEYIRQKTKLVVPKRLITDVRNNRVMDMEVYNAIIAVARRNKELLDEIRKGNE